MKLKERTLWTLCTYNPTKCQSIILVFASILDLLYDILRENVFCLHSICIHFFRFIDMWLVLNRISIVSMFFYNIRYLITHCNSGLNEELCNILINYIIVQTKVLDMIVLCYIMSLC